MAIRKVHLGFLVLDLAAAAAKLLISLGHDWALAGAMSALQSRLGVAYRPSCHDWALAGAMSAQGPTPTREKKLRGTVDAVRVGLRPG